MKDKLERGIAGTDEDTRWQKPGVKATDKDSVTERVFALEQRIKNLEEQYELLEVRLDELAGHPDEPLDDADLLEATGEVTIEPDAPTIQEKLVATAPNA